MATGSPTFEKNIRYDRDGSATKETAIEAEPPSRLHTASRVSLPKIDAIQDARRVKSSDSGVSYAVLPKRQSAGLPMLPPILQKKDKETIQEYIEKKRELLLIQYNLNLKEAEVKELSTEVDHEEEQLNQLEKELVSEIKHFEDFLQHCKTQSQEASQRAEEAIKLKMEKMQEIKRVQSQIDTIKCDIVKYEDLLKELQVYETFLMSLMNEVTHREVACDNLQQAIEEDSEQQAPQSPLGFRELDSETFDPHALMSVYDNIRDQNVRLLELHVREARMTEGLTSYRDWVRQIINGCIRELKLEQTTWANTLKESQHKASQTKLVLKLFATQCTNKLHQRFNNEYAVLQAKVNEVYEACVRPNDAKLKPIDLLTEMECLLEELIETVNCLPRAKVVTLQRLRWQQRQEMLRRSRLLASKSDAGCLRCQQRDQTTATTQNPKMNLYTDWDSECDWRPPTGGATRPWERLHRTGTVAWSKRTSPDWLGPVQSGDSLDMALASTYDHEWDFALKRAQIIRQPQTGANDMMRIRPYKSAMKSNNRTKKKYDKTLNAETPHMEVSSRGFSRKPDGSFYKVTPAHKEHP